MAHDTVNQEKAARRQFCCVCLRTTTEYTTRYFDGGRRFHWCPDHADQAHGFEAPPKDQPQVIGRSGWVHERGRFAGYAFKAEQSELGERGVGAAKAEADAVRRSRRHIDGGTIEYPASDRARRLARVFMARVQYGRSRADARMIGKLTLGDFYQVDREDRAANEGRQGVLV